MKTERFDFTIPSEVLAVVAALQTAGHQAFLVGGCVRDLVIGRVPHDYDVTTSALPEQVMALFPKTIPTGVQHGTVTVMQAGEPVEVTTFRSDGEYSDGRHPDSVNFGVTLDEDLARRDFCMNAMVYDPVRKEVLDPHDGLEDIERYVVRCVGRAKDRFQEDALRMMRAIRFSAQLAFVVHGEIMDAIEELRANLRKVSAERIRDELMKTVSAPHGDYGVSKLFETGLMEFVIPEMLAGVGMAQNRFHAYDVATHSVETLGSMIKQGGDPVLCFTALIHDVGKPKSRAPHPSPDRAGEFQFLGHEDVGAEMADEICRRLKFSNEDRERVVTLIRFHVAGLHLKGAKKPAFRRLVRDMGAERVPDLLALMKADIIGGGIKGIESEIAPFEEKLRAVLEEKPVTKASGLAINGHDVMQALALPPGPQVGKALDALLERVTDDPSLNTREGLLALLPSLPSFVF